MLRITAVEKAKKKGYHLFVEEEYALTISAEVLAQTGLAAGQQITPQRLDEIRQLCDRQRAREQGAVFVGEPQPQQKGIVCQALQIRAGADRR